MAISSSSPALSLYDALYDKAETRHFTVLILGSYAMTLLMQIISHFASRALLPQTYPALPLAQRDEWNTRICSSFHAFAVSALSCRVMLTEGPSLYEDVRHHSYLAPVCLAITTGYLLADATLVLYSTLPRSLQSSSLPYGPLSAPVPTLAHHLLGAMAFSSSLYFRAGYVLSIMFIATELSTPLVNLRWHLIHMGSNHGLSRPTREGGRLGGKARGREWTPMDGGKDKGPLARWARPVDMAMVVVFGVCRVLVLPFQFKMVTRHVIALGKVSRWWVSVQCGASFVVIAVLNVWWFGKMLALLKKRESKRGRERSNRSS
ncbi:hypothetical protein VYU27_009862 [Nannochloropsis oceanica]